ncbi:MAG: UDP-2,3-diacylglucosamine diphosphatase [Thermofilum sp.]
MKIDIIEASGIPLPLITLEDEEEAVILSDTHLGLNVKGRVASKSRELAEFFAHLRSTKTKLVVLLGDVLELWNAPLHSVMRAAYEPLRELSRSNATVVYVAGNHDRILAGLHLIGRRGEEDLVVAPEAVLLEVSGRKALLFHGHQLDRAFLITRSLWKLQSYVYTFSEALLALPKGLEWVLAGLAALLFLGLIAIIPAGSLVVEIAVMLLAAFLLSPLLLLLWRNFQDEVWYLLIQPLAGRLSRGRLRGKSMRTLAVSKPLRKLLGLIESIVGHVDIAVFGHTHVPELLEDNGRVFANTGSWVENGNAATCTFLRVKPGEILLSQWANGAERVLARAAILPENTKESSQSEGAIPPRS